MYHTKTKIQNIILFINDFICLIVSYLLSGYIWLILYKQFSFHFMKEILSSKFLIIILANTLIGIFYNTNSSFFKRNKVQELKIIIKTNLILASTIAIIDLFMGSYDSFSRGVYILTIFFNSIFMSFTRKLIKVYLIRIRKHRKKTSQLFIITTNDRATNVLELMNRKTEWSNKISSMAIIDENRIGQDINHIPIVATFDNMLDYVKSQVIDEVFIHVPYNIGKSFREIILELEDMGVVVHINVDVLEDLYDFNKSINMMGDIPVITIEYNCSENRLFKNLVKRLIDILGSIVGILITLIVSIFLVGFIKGESKGPLFFKQQRVGKNGRCFYIYKFRSMCNNAESLKESLMEKNEMKGLMFKIQDDPRITKVGRFIRKYSIDELPQFFNVFKGDMSLVGTRPPTLDEFKQYKSYHKRRLCTKPGMTGLWQISGKDFTNDFEEVVKLDLQYIDNWGLLMDLRILLLTLLVIIKKPRC